MPLVARLIPDNLTYSASDGIGGGTGRNFIFLTLPTTCSRVLKCLALCNYVFMYLFLRRRCPGHTV